MEIAAFVGASYLVYKYYTHKAEFNKMQLEKAIMEKTYQKQHLLDTPELFNTDDAVYMNEQKPSSMEISTYNREPLDLIHETYCNKENVDFILYTSEANVKWFIEHDYYNANFTLIIRHFDDEVLQFIMKYNITIIRHNFMQRDYIRNLATNIYRTNINFVFYVDDEFERDARRAYHEVKLKIVMALRRLGLVTPMIQSILHFAEPDYFRLRH